MKETRRLELSDEWKVRKGWGLDLGDFGFGKMSGDGEILDDGVAIVYLDRYEFKDWGFTDVEVEIKLNKMDLKEIEEIKTLDDVLICGWDDYTINSTSKTRIIRRGNPNSIKNTTFEELIEEGD